MTTPPPDGGQPRPDGSQPPAYSPPPAYSAAPPPAYSAAPPPSPQYSAPPPSQPGKTLGIVAFVLSILMPFIGLILGIVALVQSKRVGQKNGWAVAAIIVGSVLIVLGIIVTVLIIAVFLPQAAQLTQEILEQCRELGPGIHEINGVPVNCSDILTE
jgi:hypothetical protein